MSQHLWLWCACVLLGALGLLNSAYADIRVIDDSGQEVVLERPAQRIISLAPHLTELLYHIDSGDTVVATVEYADYPEKAKQLPRLGNAQTISLESIIAYQPDLLLAWQSGNPPKIVSRVKALGIPVFINEAKQLSDIGLTMGRLGQLVGKGEFAQQLANQFSDELQQMRSRYQPLQKMKVFYQVWNEPLLTVNQTHLIGQAINLCGGLNIFSDQSNTIPNVNREAVVVANPDIMVAAMHSSRTDINTWQDSWRPFSVIKAVAEQQFYNLPADWISRPSHRMLQGIGLLCQSIDYTRTIHNNH